jgi:WD40 repeat protein
MADQVEHTCDPLNSCIQAERASKGAADRSEPRFGRRRPEERITADRRLAWLVVALAGTVLLALGVGVYAIGQHLKVEQQARVALSHQLAVQALLVREERPQRSLLLGLEALNVTLRAEESRPPLAEEALRQTLANTGGHRLIGHQGPVTAVTTSPDGRWLVTVSDDYTARLWDFHAPDPTTATAVLRGHQARINATQISVNGRWLVTVSDDYTARLWDLHAPDPAATPLILRGHQGAVLAAAFSPDDRWLVTGSRNGTVRLWKVSGLPLLSGTEALNTGSSASDLAAVSLVLPGHQGAVLAAAFSPDGRWLVTGSEDSSAHLWDVSDLAVLSGAEGLSAGLNASNPAPVPFVLRGHGFGINTVSFSPDDRWLVTASWEGIARLWDLSAADPVATSRLLFGHEFWITSVAFSPDSRWLITAGVDDTARLWDLNAPDPSAARIVLSGHRDWIIGVSISPDGRWLVTGSGDGTARLWDLTSPDPATGSVVLRGHQDWINAVAFSPDARGLVTGSRDGTARLWDLTTPDPAAAPLVLRGHRRAIVAVAFSPDGRWLVTGSGDSAALLWPLQLEELVKLACRSAGRNLTRAEWAHYLPGHAYRATCPNLPITAGGDSGLTS